MNQTIKNILGVAGVIVLLAVSVTSFQYVQAFRDSIEPSSFRSFSASGEGKVMTAPDLAKFTFSVRTEGDENTAAIQDENTERVNQAITFLRGQGVKEKDIQTQQYTIRPRYQRFSCPPERRISGAIEPCPPSEIVGYTVHQSVEVSVRNFNAIGGLISGVVENGANEVSNLFFTIENPEEVRREARQKAIQNAQEEARAIAEAAGFTVGRLLSVDENSYRPFYGRTVAEEFGAADDGHVSAPTPTIEPGSQEVTANVTLRYEIK